MKPRTRSLLIHAFAATAALSMAACGGSGDDNDDDSSPPPPPPPPVTLSGEVARIGPLQNVVVCLDLNANDACDDGEPTSAATGADGRYSLTYDPSAVPGAASARLIALVKTGDPAAATTAIDSATPAVAATDADYVMHRPAGSGGAINPLTTLVQAGVAAGMTDAAARANVALQLAIDATKIDAYQDDPAWDANQIHDTARMAAAVVSGMLRTGVPLEVGDQQAAAPASTTQHVLRYVGPDDYFERSNDRQAKAAGSAGVQFVDNRSGKSGGQPSPDNALYGTAFLTPSGWTYCTRDVVHRSTVGNPSRTVYCDGETTLGSTRASSVAGQAMADLVDRWQTLPTNTINVGMPTVGLKGALGATVFPAGAEELLRTNVVLGSTIQIDALANRAQPQSRKTLEALINHYPTSGAAAPTVANTLSLALTTSALKNLRVSMAPSSATQGSAQYYECDLNAEQTVVSNCVPSTTGTYSIDDVNGERVLRFTGQPPTPAIRYHVVYSEIRWVAGDPNSQSVYRAHETKPGLVSRQAASHRLNEAAWTAMKTQLGL